LSDDPDHRVSLDGSRSRVWWELRQAVGVETAARRWPQKLTDLLALRPELSSLVVVEAERSAAPQSYRESARGGTSYRLRASAGGLRRSLALLAFALLALPFGWWVGGFFFAWLFGGMALATGLATLPARFRREAIRVEGGSLKVLRGGAVQTELRRDEMAYVEVRSIEDKALADRQDVSVRAMQDLHFSPSWVCVQTKDGELHTLGRPVDEAAATAICVALEEELELLPDVGVDLVRARVSGSEPVEERVEVVDAPRSRRGGTEASGTD